MKYYVVSDGKNGVNLFLIDRNKSKSAWWTPDLYNAIAFNKSSAAEYSAKRLIYRNARVISELEAKELEKDNMHILAELDDHPFSSEALGQD